MVGAAPPYPPSAYAHRAPPTPSRPPPPATSASPWGRGRGWGRFRTTNVVGAAPPCPLLRLCASRAAYAVPPPSPCDVRVALGEGLGMGVVPHHQRDRGRHVWRRPAVPSLPLMRIAPRLRHSAPLPLRRPRRPGGGAGGAGLIPTACRCPPASPGSSLALVGAVSIPRCTGRCRVQVPPTSRQPW